MIMQKSEKSKPSTDKNDRRRGRPSGKNRVPLSLEERRARNAQYERERRNETAEAMAQLAEAASCDPQITNPELLATVINRLQEEAARNPSESIENLKRINDNLESQIAALENRLKSNNNFKDYSVDEAFNDTTSSQSDSSSDSDSDSDDSRPAKYRKTTQKRTVHSKAATVIQNSSQSSSDSQDSDWSHHRLGKTFPGEELQHSDSKASIHNSSSVRIPNYSIKSEFFSISSSQDAPEHLLSQQEVKVEFQLVPDGNQIKTEPNVEESTNSSFMDPFTDREKGILKSIGCRDFIAVENDNENEPRLSWPLDFDDYLAGSEC